MSLYERSVYVQGLKDVDTQELRNYCSAIDDPEYILVDTPTSAFVVFPEIENVRQAIKKLDRKKLKGTAVSVKKFLESDEQLLTELIEAADENRTEAESQGVKGQPATNPSSLALDSDDPLLTGKNDAADENRTQAESQGVKGQPATTPSLLAQIMALPPDEILVLKRLLGLPGTVVSSEDKDTKPIITTVAPVSTTTDTSTIQTAMNTDTVIVSATGNIVTTSGTTNVGSSGMGRTAVNIPIVTSSSIPPYVFPGAPATPYAPSFVLPSSHSYQTPRLHIFSGLNNKGEVTYQQWRLQLSRLCRDTTYPGTVLLQSVTNSLRSPAVDVLQHLSDDHTVHDVLAEMDRYYGNVLSVETLLEQFYNAKQKEKESIAEWGARLRDLAKQVERRDSTQATEVSTAKLTARFFKGLFHATMKTSLRHKFDGGVGFDDLLLSGRVLEAEELGNESSTSPTQKTLKVQQLSAGGTLESLTNEVKQMREQMTKLQASVQDNKKYSNYKLPKNNDQGEFRGYCFKCKKQGHKKNTCPLNSSQPTPEGEC